MKWEKKCLLFLPVFLCIVLFLFSSVPVRAEGMVRIDANKKYKGMNASFAKGYVPSIRKNTMHLIVPFRSEAAVRQESLSVGVTFEREENSPFYFKNYQKQVSPSENGVYLYKCNIKLRADRVNGQYPLYLSVLAKTTEGTVREEFTIYVEISDGRNPRETEETPEGVSEEERQGMAGEQTEEKEEIIHQPRILIDQNSFQKKDIAAGSGEEWTLSAKNCSESQEIQNMKVTLLTENKDILFEKSSWYFAQVDPGKEMDLSQYITVGKKALEETAPIQFQFEYEDKKGTAYSCTETVHLSVSQTQRASLVDFVMPESIYESDTESVSFQIQNTGLAVIYNARVNLYGTGLFAQEVFLGNIEAGASLDGEMQIFAGTLNMDENGNITDEHAEKYGDVSGRVVFSFENEQGEIVEQEQMFSTAIKKPQVVELKIEEEKPETNQWWQTIVVLVILTLFLTVIWLYLRMKHYQRMGWEMYEKTKHL